MTTSTNEIEIFPSKPTQAATSLYTWEAYRWGETITDTCFSVSLHSFSFYSLVDVLAPISIEESQRRENIDRFRKHLVLVSLG